MKKICFALLALTASSAGIAATPAPLCVSEPARMPESWQPSPELHKTLSRAPWSRSETKDVERAVARGVDEMIAHFKRRPSAIDALWDDSIEALIQVTYASANPPALDARVREAARSNLTRLIDLFFERRPDPRQVTCDDFESLMPLAIFAHRLYPADDPRTKRVTQRVNAAYRVCGSLADAMGYDHREVLAASPVPVERLFQLHVWALWFMAAEAHPAIALPDEAGTLGQELWEYFKTYRFAGAGKLSGEDRNDRFIAMADLAPHVVHMMTAVNRFPIYVEDAPALYRFHRESFYAVMRLNQPDLFASFVDTLRQYGCTPDNDIQVRDGTRYLMNLFHENGDRWMGIRSDGETEAATDDYDLIHYPWTAVLGIRDRRLVQPDSVIYGDVARRWQPLREKSD